MMRIWMWTFLFGFIIGLVISVLYFMGKKDELWYLGYEEGLQEKDDDVESSGKSVLHLEGNEVEQIPVEEQANLLTIEYYQVEFDQQWDFDITDKNGNVIAVSPRVHTDKEKCLNQIRKFTNECKFNVKER